MTGPSVVVFEYGAGNVHSACQALTKMGASVTLTDDPTKVRAAHGIVVPGVGAFGYVVERFRSHGGDTLLQEWVEADKPLLGICVGMQILFKGANEKGSHAGLGFLDGNVGPLPATRLPHMGWGQVSAPADSLMFKGIGAEYFYFVHSYARLSEPGKQVENLQYPGRLVKETTAIHGTSFLAAFETGPIWATQFHPEKSGAPGQRLLGNWLATLEQQH